MVETATKLPIKTEAKSATPAPATAAWHPFEDLRREVDRLFEDFGRGSWFRPLRSIEPMFQREVWTTPAVDMVEKDGGYEITAELPGLEDKDVEVKVAGGAVTIRGQKSEQKEEQTKEYHLSERRYGSFQRSFRVPEDVDPDGIEASFAKGVLTVTLPKSPAKQASEKKISIKSS